MVDLHNLPDRAQRFVVGVTLKTEFERKEKAGTAKPLLFVVLDELNKYAPREGSSPIKEVLLDIAERGRSLGVILIGAQQTASEVERRIVTNSAIRVVGRLDPAEASRPEYGFLPPAQRQRALLAKPGTMFVNQPDIPVPLCLEFPFPAWATRVSEAGPAPSETLRSITQSADPFAVVGSGAAPRRRHPVLRSWPGARPPVKILHTSDWHVGKVLKGQSRARSTAVLAEVIEIARAERPDLVDRRRRPLRHRRAHPGGDPAGHPGADRAARAPARTWSRSAATTTTARRWTRCAPGPRPPASPCAAGSGRTRPSTSSTGAPPPANAWRLAALPFLSQRYAVRARGDVRADRRRGQPDLRRPPGRGCSPGSPRASPSRTGCTWSPPT